MAESLLYHIDHPATWQRLSRYIEIRGWCFSVGGGPICGVRLHAEHLIIAGVVGLPRPDVRSALPAAPHENTGFAIRGVLPAGQFTFLIEAALPDGTWEPFFRQKVEIICQYLPDWVIGGSLGKLIATQMPCQMIYPPRSVRLERFPNLAHYNRLNLSIVTPTYNQAKYLPETMRSVLDQAGTHCQYVVQDGGSVDGSLNLIRRQGDRLHTWTSECDNGQADAITKGFFRTSGNPQDLMAWINSDDFYLPGALRFVSEYFARHPNVDVIYGHRIVVDENSQEIGRWFLPKHDPSVLRLNDFVPQETLFWRRRIWDRVGGIDTSFNFAMDWDLLLRFQAAGAKIVRVPYFLACFRVHPAQKTSAQMHSVGQAEIDRLRTREQGRLIPPSELEQDPRLIRYLKKSAFIEFLWKLGIRAP